MINMIPSIALLFLFVFLFCREVRLDRQRYLEQDRLGDEHILLEIERFLKEKNAWENSAMAKEKLSQHKNKLTNK